MVVLPNALLIRSAANPDSTIPFQWGGFYVGNLGCRSSSLPGSSGERWYGGYGGDDGFGSLGLTLRNFLAFVLELKR